VCVCVDSSIKISGANTYTHTHQHKLRYLNKLMYIRTRRDEREAAACCLLLIINHSESSRFALAFCVLLCLCSLIHIFPILSTIGIIAEFCSVLFCSLFPHFKVNLYLFNLKAKRCCYHHLFPRAPFLWLFEATHTHTHTQASERKSIIVRNTLE